MINGWKVWKGGFDRWERQTATYLNGLLQSPTVLAPSGKVLDLLMQSKAAADKGLAMWWSTLGLANKETHERSLHRINQLESRILDLEEELAELRADDEGGAS